MRPAGARSATVVAAAALVVSALAPAASGGSAGPRAPRSDREPDRGRVVEQPGPRHLLPRSLPGRAALSRLDAGGLDEAAATNGLGVGRLRRLLGSDPTAWLSPDGRLSYVDPPGPDAAATAAAGAAATAAAPTAAAAPPGQTFKLHSRSGADRTIYLDFDGGPVADTWWNQQRGLPATTEPPWSADADPAFDNAELTAIQDVWARVAEDYAPFDVDVTTEPPDPARISRVGTDDPTYGVHLLIGRNDDAWLRFCTRGCGGIAPVNTIGVLDATATSEYLRLGWVFTDALVAPDLATRAKFFADAASHEAGHLIGLHHDGTPLTPDYYLGTALWGPIMGAPYLSAVTQWSKGEYADANQPEDDTAIIGGQLGLRPDETGDTVATAVPRTADTAYVGTPADRDVYALGRCDGAVSVAAQPVPLGPDLDLSLTLLTAAGTAIATSAPTSAARTGLPPAATGLDARIDRPVADGDYFVRVDGVGQGDPLSTGYTDYGSLGGYTLETTGCTAPGSTVPSAPTSVGATVAGTDLVVTWEPPASDGGAGVNGYEVRADGGAWQGQPPSARSVTLAGLGTARHAVEVRALNSVGPSAPALAPTLPAAVGSLRGTADTPHRSARLTWTAPTDTGRSPVTSYRLATFDAAGRQTSEREWLGTAATITGLTPGQTYRFGVSAVNAVGEGPVSRVTVTMPPVVRVPGAPTIGRPSPGRRGGAITAIVRWSPPRSNGGAAIDHYRVTLYQLTATGRVARTSTVTVGVRTSTEVRLAPRKQYRFAVQAHNRAGWGPASARSAAVRGR